MIIGEALGRLINGTTIDLNIEGDCVNREIQYHYGDHKELIKWITDRDKGRMRKYPLIWYVTAPYTELPNGYKEVKTNIIILQSTEIHWLNTKRSVKSYDQIIEPVWAKFKKMLERSQYIDVIGARPSKYRIKDEPSYGVNADGIRLGQNDFTSKKSKGDESVALDVVDGRLIELNLRININCI